MSLRVAAPSAVTDALHLASASGTNLSGNVNIPATGGWQTWTTVTARSRCRPGQQVLTVGRGQRRLEPQLPAVRHVRRRRLGHADGEPVVAHVREPDGRHDQRDAGGHGDQHRYRGCHGFGRCGDR